MKITKVYGKNVILQLLQHSPERIIELHYDSAKADNLASTLDLARFYGITQIKSNAKTLACYFDGVNTQGLVASIKGKPFLFEKNLAEFVKNLNNPLILILDGVQDPHNLGACIRVVEAAGADLLIMPQDKSVNLTPIVRKVASGAVEFINIMHVKNIARVIEQLQELGVWVTGTSLEASAHIYTMDFSGPCAIVLGTEGEGLRELTAKKCDHLANIPMQGVTQSLNLSVCAGICLFEANRQRL